MIFKVLFFYRVKFKMPEENYELPTDKRLSNGKKINQLEFEDDYRENEVYMYEASECRIKR